MTIWKRLFCRVGFLVWLLPMPSAATATEVLQTLWRGQWVNYVERGEYAVVKGNIRIGRKDIVRAATLAAEARLTSSHEQVPKALTVDLEESLWPRGASGIAEVSYVIEGGNAAIITAAIAEINRLLAGTLQWVPRTTQVDYVAFNVEPPGFGYCEGSLGRMGGRQTLLCDDRLWQIAGLFHEAGHVMGLYHTQSDVNADPFIETRLNRIPPPYRIASDKLFYSRTLNGYDYASTMHYRRDTFWAYADALTIETKPPGIDIGEPPTYSTADVDAIKRLYGSAPSTTTIVTHPAGLSLVVDGVTITTPMTYNWPLGSVHRIWAPNGLQTLNGYQFGFARWSQDASATPSPQLTWQVIPGDGTLGAPTTVPMSSVLTANFVRLMSVTATASTQIGGTVTVTPRVSKWPGTVDLYPQYSVFDIHTVPSAGFQSYFTYLGGVYVYGGGVGLTRNTTFSLPPRPTQTIGAAFHSGRSIGLDVIGPGMTDGIEVTVTPPASKAEFFVAPLLSRDTAGSWI